MASTNPDSAAGQMLDELAVLLRGLDDRLVIIGGVAFNFWGRPRYTHDVDFNAAADKGLMTLITERLTGAGYVITRNQAEGAPSGPDFVQFKHSGYNPPHVVEFQAAKTDYQDLTISRGVRLSPEQPFAVATAEDLLVLKLIANRPQDISDCVELAKLPGIDWPYIDHWCGVWQVQDRAAGLREAIEQERRRIDDLHR